MLNDVLVPPQNLEAEISVLGALLLDRDALIKIGDVLIAEDFYDFRHKVIYECIINLFETNTAIDVLTVANKLEEKKHLERIGGNGYLARLVSLVPTSANVVHYANIVRKKGTLRRLINQASEIQSLAYKEDGDIDEILDSAEKKLFLVSQKHLKQNFEAISSVLHSTFDRIDQLHRDKGALRGVPTGFHDLDNLLGGLQRSDLIILAARPSMGKTSLALNMALNVAINTKQGVGVFSLEMSKDQLVERLLASQAGINLWKIRTGQLNEKDFEVIGESMGYLSEAPIFIDDSAGATVNEVRTKARRLKSEQNIGLIVIDYLQLMHGKSTDNRVQEVSEISRSLKILARELNVPVIALSQLSRNVENRPDKVPNLADLRESGSIEQDADVVMFIYRDEMYKGKESKRQGIAEIHIRKHRNGPVGQVDLYFDSDKTLFKNLDKSFRVNPTQFTPTPQEI